MKSPFSEVITTARIAAGLTQEQAAEAAEIPLRGWQDLEQTQKRLPSDPERWRRICAAIRRDPEETALEILRREGYCDG